MIEKVLIGPAERLSFMLRQHHLDGMYDDKELGFDYQEHLIRKCFEEKGSDISVYLIYKNFH